MLKESLYWKDTSLPILKTVMHVETVCTKVKRFFFSNQILCFQLRSDEELFQDKQLNEIAYYYVDKIQIIIFTRVWKIMRS